MTASCAVLRQVHVELDRIGPGLHAEPEGLHRVLRRLDRCAPVRDDQRHLGTSPGGTIAGSRPARQRQLVGRWGSALRHVADDQEADHHQHQQRQDGDLVGERPVLLRVQHQDDPAEQQRANHGRQLAGHAVQAEHLADLIRAASAAAARGDRSPPRRPARSPGSRRRPGTGCRSSQRPISSSPTVQRPAPTAGSASARCGRTGCPRRTRR